jgi:hypothetical protein
MPKKISRYPKYQFLLTLYLFIVLFHEVRLLKEIYCCVCSTVVFRFKQVQIKQDYTLSKMKE